jgi:sulfide:quinone oxidoreductase
MQNKSIVILGGGTGGIVAANKLRSKLPSDIKIILIERNPFHTFAASYLWLMVGLREPEKISTSLSKLITSGVEIINEEVKHIDTSSRKVQIESREINYDYLIVSLGTDLDKKYMENYKDGIHNFYTFEGAKRLKEELNKFKSGEII